MMRKLRSSVLGTCILATAIVPPLPARGGEAAVFLAGFAERDITPEIGMEMPGGYGKAFHARLHDPCKVRAAVFEGGSRRATLVSVDALMVPRHLVSAARDRIEKLRGIPPEATLVGATHSHSSGPTGMVQPGEYDGAPELIRSLAYEKSSAADARYLDRVLEAIVEAVAEADENRTPAAAGVAVGIEGTVAFNRRFRMRGGLTFTHPGKGNPDIACAAGPIDPEVGVVGAWSPEGKLLGCVVTYACHATTNPPGISANWIYYLEKTIRGAFDSDAIVVFLQGFSGDVTQVDNLSPFAERPGEDGARFVGARVGAEAVKALVGMARGPLVPVEARSKVLRIARRRPAPERVERCLEIVRRSPKEVGGTEWTFAKEIVLLDWKLQSEPVAEVEVQAVEVGPAVFLTSPGETFSALGLELKRRSPFPFTFPVELANGCAGYIPTEDALGEGGGGYETRLTSYTNLEPAAGTRINEALLELARGLSPGETPRRPLAPPFREPWSYGNVPPELR
ncbi:MAG: hypothetical protein ACUVYA_01125 [Planctomycetota bacterium]